MTKLAPLVLVASLLSGCFTVTGGVIGAQVSASEQREREAKLAQGERVAPHDDNAVLAGIVIGLALDVLAIYAISQSVDNSGPTYWYGSPSETRGY
jgi:hypothetical protein